jgi:hypothetical protein
MPVPTPVNVPATVTCPSCGSEYNPGTRELVVDTQLQARIRELEAQSEILRTNGKNLRAELVELDIAKKSLIDQLAKAQAPRVNKSRDFIVNK